jgi:hypothetical protein
VSLCLCVPVDLQTLHPPAPEPGEDVAVSDPIFSSTAHPPPVPPPRGS